MDQAKEQEMKGLFRMEGPLFDGLSRMADLIIINLIFVVCCIPVVTAGAALTGLSYVMLKIKDKEEGYVIKSYFKSFKQNFRQATVIWLLMLAFAFVLYIDFRMLSLLGGLFHNVMWVLLFFAVFIWAILLIYVFPLLSRFDNTIRQTMTNALLIALANAPQTLLLIFILGAAVAITFFNYTTIIYSFMFWFLIGFALIAWINAFFLSRIFRKLMPVEEVEETAEEYEVNTIETPDANSDTE